MFSKDFLENDSLQYLIIDDFLENNSLQYLIISNYKHKQPYNKLRKIFSFVIRLFNMLSCIYSTNIKELNRVVGYITIQ